MTLSKTISNIKLVINF